jgi:hypothetical protein
MREGLVITAASAGSTSFTPEEAQWAEAAQGPLRPGGSGARTASGSGPSPGGSVVFGGLVADDGQ